MTQNKPNALQRFADSLFGTSPDTNSEASARILEQITSELDILGQHDPDPCPPRT